MLIDLQAGEADPGSCVADFCTNGRPSAAALRLLARLAECGASIPVRADDDAAGQAIVATVRRVIPNAKLWRFEARPPVLPRYEEQDLPLLLQDLRQRLTASGEGNT